MSWWVRWELQRIFIVSKGMDAPLPVYWQAAIAPVSHIHRVHSTWKCITLQLKLFHQLAHCNVLLRIYSTRLVLEECHQDFESASCFVLRRRRSGRDIIWGAGAHARVRGRCHGNGTVSARYLTGMLPLHRRINAQRRLVQFFNWGL